MDKKNNSGTGSEITENLDSEQHGQSGESVQSDQRRKAVRNILAGSGLTVAAVTAESWVKPVVNAVILPSHAQMSAPMPIVLAGNASIGPVVGVDPDKLPGSSSVLDFFIGPANAGVTVDAGSLSGACMTMTVPGNGTFTLNVEFAEDPPILVSGTVSAGSISGSGGGLTVTGSIDLAAATPMAMGTISDVISTHSFTIDGATSGCMPIGTTPAPTTSTTAAPPTSIRPTTSSTPSTSPGAPPSPRPTTSSTPPPPPPPPTTVDPGPEGPAPTTPEPEAAT